MKSVFVSLLSAVLVMLAPGAHGATGDYPTKPITIIVPYAAGDGTDVVARLVGAKMSELLGQPVVVENRAGVGGQIGLKHAAAAPNDGYTITLGQAATLALFPHTYKAVPYDALKDFVPVAGLAANYLAITARKDSPFKTIPEMIEWAKANPDTLTMGSTSNGGFQHMAMVQLAKMGGFTFRNIPYKGMQQVVTDLVGGRIDVALPPYTIIAPMVQNGSVTMMGITYPARDPGLPDLPSASEAVKGYGAVGWYGFLAPAGTPEPIVRKLNDAINQALKMPDVKKTMTNLGLIQIIDSPEYFGDLIRTEHEKYGKLVKEIGYEPQ